MNSKDRNLLAQGAESKYVCWWWKLPQTRYRSKPAVLCDSSRDSDSDSEIVTRDSGSSHARVQASPSCLLWHSIHFVVCFHVLEDKQMLNMWTTRFVTRTLNSFLTRTRTRRWGDDSDLDSEVMTRTRTQRWLGLGLGFDNLDSDTALQTSRHIGMQKEGNRGSGPSQPPLPIKKGEEEWRREGKWKEKRIQF